MENCVIELLHDTITEQKKINRRLFVVILTLIVMLLFTNVSWLIYESQFSQNSDVAELYAEDSGLNIYGDANTVSRGTE